MSAGVLTDIDIDYTTQRQLYYITATGRNDAVNLDGSNAVYWDQGHVYSAFAGYQVRE